MAAATGGVGLFPLLVVQRKVFKPDGRKLNTTCISSFLPFSKVPPMISRLWCGLARLFRRTHPIESDPDHPPEARDEGALIRLLELLQSSHPSNTEYLHEPLPEGPFIRLLELLPSASPSSPVTIEVNVYQIKEAPPYEALSYTWGDPLPTLWVQCGKMRLKVRRSLHTALLRLRSFTRRRRLWIDAICINQNSPAENNHQIPFMRRIFENAETVVVWLGEEADGSTAAISALTHLVQGEGPAVNELDSSRDYIYRVADYSGDSPIGSAPIMTERRWAASFNMVGVVPSKRNTQCQ